MRRPMHSEVLDVAREERPESTWVLVRRRGDDRLLLRVTCVPVVELPVAGP